MDPHTAGSTGVGEHMGAHTETEVLCIYTCICKNIIMIDQHMQCTGQKLVLMIRRITKLGIA